MREYSFLRRVATLIEQVEAGTIDYKRFYKDVKTASINAAYERNMSKEELGKRIKDIRINMKLTMEQFANKIHEHTNEVQPTKSNVSRWERGENVPNDLSLKAIADLAGITVEELLEENAEDAFFYTKGGK